MRRSPALPSLPRLRASAARSAAARACAALSIAAAVGCGAEPVEGEPAPADISAALANLPACEPVVSDGRIDLVAGCFDGLCVGQTYWGMVEGIGYEGLCTALDEPEDTVECHWDGQIFVRFVDKDRDGSPDSDVTASELLLTGGLEAGTIEGLGVAASTSCFIAQYGEPDRVTWAEVNGDYALVDAVWLGWGLHLTDDDGPPGSLDPDGKVDQLTTTGAR